MDKQETDQPENPNVGKMKEFLQKLDALLKEYNIDMQGNIDFPIYKQLPEEVSLALLVIQNHKAKWIVDFKIKETK